MNPTDSRCILLYVTYKYANPNGFKIYVGFQTKKRKRKSVLNLFHLLNLCSRCRSILLPKRDLQRLLRDNQIILR